MSEQSFTGLGVCAGIAFGKVHLVDRRRVTAPHFHVVPERRAQEILRFEAAVKVSEQQLDDLDSRAAGTGLGQVQALLQAHKMILRDAALLDATRQRISDEGMNAEWALQDTVRELKQLFDRLDHDYFKERRSDIDVVGDRLMRNLIGAETELLGNISEDAVVVAYDLSPADTVSLAKFKAKAFVTESGGPTSHTAILARALDVPCVLNVHGIMDVAGFGDDVIVDGMAGEVVLRPDKVASSRFKGVARRREKARDALLVDRDLPAETTDGVQISLLGNIEVTQEIEGILTAGGEGVGLYRTEFLYIEQPSLRGADAHYAAYARVAERMKGHVVTIRTVDIGGDKFLRRATDEEDTRAALSPPPAENPALGLRAIRLSLRDEGPFREQLEGILRAAVHGKVQVLLPLVTELEELRRTRQIITELEADLEARGRPHVKNIPVGIMVETPASAVVADLLAREADFLAIGTNDLVQYTLATDRSNEDVAYLYRPCHPAVLRLIDSVCRGADSQGIPARICGEMAADPFHTPLLIGLGLRSFSMTARSIPVVKRMIRRLSAAECREFAQEALKMSCARDVETALAERLKAWSPELFAGG
ncbi:MAG: phosphoenolpyruvate--protein phosphotransferase [Myxococcales bacterium]|nr:phosphoenolpyruvate--protein phosphotransferase [Myxococcales bacterium]